MTTAPGSSRNSPSAGRWFALTLVLMLVSAGAAPLSAHRLDEYLQAARLDISASRVELVLDLTPGVSVAERVLADIDLNANRSISAGEARAYVDTVLRAIALDLDGAPLRLVRLDHSSPTVGAILQGTGTFTIRAGAALPRVSEGLHHLRYRNSHRSDVGAYLANALVPASDRVTVTEQRRSPSQQELIVDYTMRAGPAPSIDRGLLAVITAALACVSGWWLRRFVR